MEKRNPFNFLKSEICPYLFLILVGLFLFTYNLGSLYFVDEDEAMYAEVAREMLERQDWIYPHCNYAYWIDKPPLVPWGIAISFKLFGINEFTVRLWHSIIAVFGILVIYLIAKELFNSEVGLFSGLILATSLQYFYQARMVLCDIPLTFFITLSLYFFLIFVRRRIIFFYYLSVVAMALATLTKGPIGFVIPVLVIGIYLFFTREKLFTRSGPLHTLMGLLLFSGIVSPWFIMQILRYKWHFIDRFFLFKNLERILRPIDVVSTKTKPDPIYSYIFIIAAGFLPWSGVMCYSVYQWIKKCRKEKKKEIFFPLMWAGVIFLLFTLVAMKVPRYIMPIYPVLAIITGKFFEEENGPRFLPFLLSIVLVPFILGAVVIAKSFFPAEAGSYLPVLMPTFIILGVGIFVSSVLLLKNKKIAFLSFFITAFVSYAILVIFASVFLKEMGQTKIFAEKISQTLKDGDEILNYRPGGTRELCGEEPSLTFYTRHRVDFVRYEKELISRLNLNVRVFCIAPESEIELIKEKIPINILKEKSGRVLFTNR